MNTPSICITTGRGKVGSRIVQRLQALGITHRSGSRTGSLPFDWDNEQTWQPFVRECDTAFVAYVPDVGFAGAAERVARFGAIARSSGVRDFVLLSGRGEPGAVHTEECLADAVGPITVLRCAWFAQNFSEAFLHAHVLEGVIALPAGDVEEPFIDVADVADVAVACLTHPAEHRGRTYELTGPELLSFARVARILSGAIGREVGYQPVTLDEYVAASMQAGLDPAEALAYGELFRSVTDGRNAHLTEDVRTVLGRPGRTFAAYAATAAGEGRWS